MSNDPKIGLQAQLETSIFERAMQIYTAGIAKMQSLTQAAAHGISNAFYNAMFVLGVFAEKVAPGMQESAQATDKMNISAQALAVTLGTILYNAIQRVVTQVKDFVVNGINAAARVQELDYVLQIIGGRAGYTKDQLDELTKTVVNYGIQTDEAQNALVQMIRYQLDLTKSTQLARVAQDAAVIAQLNSSETLQRIIYGITTYNTEVLRTIGIQINMQKAMNDYAQTLGKNAQALTTNERAQAVMNAVLQEGTKIAGSYEAAMETAGKQMRSLPRDVFELQKVLGQPFLQSFSDIITAAREFVQALRLIFDQGGPLRETMMQIGGAAAYFTSYIKQAAKAFLDFAKGATETETKMNSLELMFQQIGGTSVKASQSFISFKSIIDQVKATLVSVAPTFATLGSTILMVVGAFIAIKLVAGTLMTAFAIASAAVSALGAAFAFLLSPIGLVSAAIVALVAIVIGVLTTTANDFRTTFTDLATEAAQWGYDIISALADGMISAITAVVNALGYIGDVITSWLIGGSPPKLLPEIDQWGANAMGEFMKGMKAAVKEIDPFTDLKQLVEKRFQDLTSTFQFQARKLKTLVDILGSRVSLTVYNFGKGKEGEEAEKPKAGGGKGLEKPDLGKIPISGAGSIEDKIKKAIEKAKEAFSTKMQEFLDEVGKKLSPITEAWQNTVNKWAPLVENAIKAVQIVLDRGINVDSITDAFKQLFAPPTKKEEIDKNAPWLMGKGVGEQAEPQINKISELIDKIRGDLKDIQLIVDTFVKTVSESFGKVGIDVPKSLNLIEIALGIFKTFLDGVSVVMLLFSTLASGLIGGIARAIEFVQTAMSKFQPTWDALSNAWNAASQNANGFIGTIEKIGIILGGIIVGAVEIVVSALAGLIGYFVGFVDSVISFFQNLYDTLVGRSIVPDMMQAIYDSIVGVIDSIITTLGEKVKEFYKAGEDFLTGMIDGVKASVQPLIDAVVDAARQAIDAVKKFLGMSSPSKVGANIGENYVKGMVQGIQTAAPDMKASMDKMMQDMVSNTRKSFNVNIGKQLSSAVTIASRGGGNTTMNTYNIDRSTSVEVNPTYKNVESPGTVYNDVFAALTSARM